MLFSKTPIGYVQIPTWEENNLIYLTDEQLLEKALKENTAFVISPSVFSMIEKRGLYPTLQYLINPHVCTRHSIIHGKPENF